MKDKLKSKLLYFLYKYGEYLSDKVYIKWVYYLTVGKRLNLNNPKTFSEKLQWLKLYDRTPLCTKLVDKILVKEYVANIIGKQYIIPTLATYNSPADIDFDKLPNQFVLKCNHNSGGLCICKDKSKLDYAKVKENLEISLKRDYYLNGREWPYKDIKRKILAETLMVDEHNDDLVDYKFFCFNGIPKLCQVISDRNTEEKIDFYDMDWNRQDGLVGLNTKVHNSSYIIDEPKTFATMKEIAGKLSKGFPFSRIDLYEINGRCYFGEITFFPLSGFGWFNPLEWNNIIGDWLELPVNKK